jgi:hypothetical protein
MLTEPEAADKLAALAEIIHGSYASWGVNDLRGAIDEALMIDAPPGKPDFIDVVVQRLEEANGVVDRARNTVAKSVGIGFRRFGSVMLMWRRLGR